MDINRRHIFYRITRPVQETITIGFSLTEDEPVNKLKYTWAESTNCNPNDIKLYYGATLIENYKLPSEYGIFPRPQNWDILLVHKTLDKKFKPENIKQLNK